jgi:DNA-binding SARP family transcriptional activator
MSLLWGAAEPAQARNSLRQLLFAIRHQLGACGVELVKIDGDLVRLDPERATIDALRFQTFARRADYDALVQAAVSYPGDLLDHLSTEGEPFEPWVVAERERLRELAMRSLRRLMMEHRERGGLDDAIETGIRILGLDALDEATHRGLMALYADQQRWGAVERQYQVCRSLLRRHLNAAPQPATDQLYRQLLDDRRNTSAEALAEMFAS